MWLFGNLVESKAQVTIIESIVSNEQPGAVYNGTTRILRACAWEYTLHVEISANAPCNNITMLLPTGINFDIQAGSGISTLITNTNPISFTVTGGNGVLDLKLLDACDIDPTFSTIDIVYDAGVGCTETVASEIYNVTTPVLSFSNYTLNYDGVAIPTQSPLGLYKKNDNTFLIREYDIELNVSDLKNFIFDYTPEMEFGPVTIEFSNPALSTSLVPITVNGISTSTTIAGVELFTLFNRDYMLDGDIIHVKETTFITQCSGVTPDITAYQLRSECTDFCTACACNINSMNYGVSVNDEYLNLRVTHTINNGYPDTFPIDICGVTAFDMEFKFENPTPHTNNVANSGHKKIMSLRVPIDLDAFDIITTDGLDLDRVLLEYTPLGGTPQILSVNDLIAIGAVPLTFCTYNSVTQVCFFDFNTGISSLITTAWNGFSPFMAWYNSTQFNDFREGDSLRIIFDNLRFLYDSTRTLGNNRQKLDECHAFPYHLLFTPDYYNIFSTYYFMCDDMNGIPFFFMPGIYLQYYNTAIVTGFAEATTADVVVGSSVGIDFYFNAPPGTDPWTFGYAYVGDNTILFDCQDNYYRVEMVMPDNLELNPNFDIIYYENPNETNLANGIPISIPPVNSIGNQNRYIIILEDQGGLPITVPNGRVTATIQMASPCVPTTSGFANVEMKVQNVCDPSCDDFVNTVACIETEIFWRCNGPCCGPPQSTSSFSFDRITPGFDLLNQTIPVVLDPFVHTLNRTYPCDHIKVKSDGQILVAGDTCDEGSNTYIVPDVDTFLFRIAYTSSAPDPGYFQFFEFVDAQYTVTQNGITSPPVNIPSISFWINPGNDPGDYELNFLIADVVVANVLQAGPGIADIQFEATMKVKDMLSDPAPGFYLLPQIRGQFVGVISSTYEELSCDDWGDNMNVLNVRTTNNFQFWDAGSASEVYHFPSSSGQCIRRFTYTSHVKGGLPGFDEFPNEFRPMVLWPEQTDPSQLTLSLPNGFSPIGLNPVWFNSQTAISGWQPVNFQFNSPTMTFTGIGTSNLPWPVLEHDGNPVELTISGELINDCPVIDAPSPNGQYNFPVTSRAFAIDDLVCQNFNILNGSAPITLSDYVLDMDFDASVLDVISSTGIIGGITQASYPTIQYTSSTLAANIENVWINNASPDITVNWIQVSTSDAFPIFGPQIFPVGGYFHLGILNKDVIYLIRISYTLNQCNTGNYDSLSLDYGFFCPGYPPPSTNNCGIENFSLNLNPLPSELAMTGASNNSNASACDNYEIILDLESLQWGNVENLVFDATLQQGITLVSASCNYNGNIFLLTTFSQIGNSYSWILDDNAPNTISYNEIETLSITVIVTGNCSLYGSSIPLLFEVTGKDICNNDLINGNNTSYLNSIVFPPYDPMTNTCTDCFQCDSLELSYIQKEDCNFSFNAIVPSSAPCTSTIIEWDFGDGAFGNGASVSHQYTQDGSYLVCYQWVCVQDSIPVDSCKVCDTLIVACKTDTFCLKIPKVNDLDIGEGIMETPDGGFAIAATIHEPGLGGGDVDMYFVKYSATLTQEYYNRIGNYGGKLYRENGNSILVRPDGYFIAGTVYVSSTDEDVFVAKIKLDGSLEYGFRYGSDEQRKEGAFKIIDMSTNREQALLVIGYAELKSGNKNVLALKLDPSDLSVIAENTYYYGEDENSEEIGYDAVKTGIHTMTDHFAIVGEQYINSNDKNIIVLNIASDLSLLSGKILVSDKRSDIGYGITAYSGSLYITGSTNYDSGPNHLIVMKLSAFNLAEESHKIFMQTGTTIEEGRKIITDSEGYLVVVGTNDTENPTSGPDALILKLRPSDDLTNIWSRSTNLQPFSERFHSVTEYAGNSYMATGSYVGASYGDEDIFVARIDKTTGESCCLHNYPVVGKKSTYSMKDVTEKSPKLGIKPHGDFPPYGGSQFICTSEKVSRLAYESTVISNELNNNIFIYPNPTTGDFIIKFDTDIQNICVIQLTDISGRLIKTIELKPDGDFKIMIDAKDVSSGIYFIEVDSKSEKWKSKILINR